MIFNNDGMTEVWYRYGHLFETAASNLFGYLLRGHMHYDAIPDFENGTVLLDISFMID